MDLSGLRNFPRAKPKARLKKGKACRTKGTEISFSPDPEIFPKIEFNVKWILERAESKAFLNKGLKIIVKEDKKTHTFQYPEGIKDFIRKIIRQQVGIGRGTILH